MKRTDITNLFPNATDEQISALMNLNGTDINNARKSADEIREKYADYDALKAKAAQFDQLQENSKSELQKAQDSEKQLRNELDALKKANAARDARDKVAAEKKVPASLLTGDTEEACRAQADAILAFAKPEGYPNLPDGGEPEHQGGAGTTADHFAEWFNEAIKQS